MEVAPGIHRIELQFAPGRLAIYALLGERVVLIDAGYAGAAGQIDAYLRRTGRSLADVDACVITHAHADHFGGAAGLRAAAPATRILVHPLDKAWVEDPDSHVRDNYLSGASYGMALPDQIIARVREKLGSGVRVDATLEEGDIVEAEGDLNLRVVHVPGHTPGHIALLDSRSGSMLAGDAVADPGVLPPAYYDAMVYVDTQRRISALGVRRLLGCHYPVLEGLEVSDFITRSTAFVEETHHVARETVRQAGRPVRLREVAEALPRHFKVEDIPERWGWAARGHLTAMERRGEVTSAVWRGLPGWEWRA